MKTSRIFRKFSYVFIVFILVLSGSAQGKPQSASSFSALGDEAPLPMDQTININNWGLGKADRKLLTEMKYKIDYLYEKSVKGKLHFRETVSKLMLNVVLAGNFSSTVLQ